MMKNCKGQNSGGSRRGFTLVEVIVVAVIVLVLAAVAIPMYNGYVEGARREAVENLAETAAAAANSLWRKTGQSLTTTTITIMPNDASNINLYFDESKHTVNITENEIEVTDKKWNNTNKKYVIPYTNKSTATKGWQG
jgi:prepilin-type N-terminal cleavage/methylation domain-containing protein